MATDHAQANAGAIFGLAWGFAVLAVCAALLVAVAISYFLYHVAALTAYGRTKEDKYCHCYSPLCSFQCPRSLLFVNWSWNFFLPCKEVELVECANRVNPVKRSVMQAPSSCFIHSSFWFYLGSIVLHGILLKVCPGTFWSTVTKVCVFGGMLWSVYLRAQVGAYAAHRAGIKKEQFTSLGSFASWTCCGGTTWHEAILATCEAQLAAEGAVNLTPLKVGAGVEVSGRR